ncbi:hypothetical protein ACHAWO_010411 [Cyclotella atomus]|uniref:Uncharacterized protein n=1 Tax=Cyclotella atomus TaxID=382360 RepID=A0ABD3MYP1_9STRA
MVRVSSRWGLSLLLLTKTACAASPWHHRRVDYRDYKSGRRSSNSRDEESSSVLDGLFKEEACTAAAVDCRPIIRAQSDKKSLSHRFSRLVKRSTSYYNLKNNVDCCVECPQYMNPASLKQCGAIPRGGHSHLHSAAASDAAASALLPLGIHLNLWKIIFQTLLTTINVLCWLLPLRSKKITSNKLALSLANAFSGGVFLSLAFGHLLPECVEGFHHSIAGEFNEALPYMLVLGGYLLIFFVEKVAFDAHEIMHEMESGGHDHSHEDEKGQQNGVLRRQSSTGTGRGAVILLGALAVHSILEMTALGLADTFGDSALLTLSIALHQPAESIALLVAFLKSGMSKPDIVKFLSIFSCMGPIGVAIGMAVNNFASPLVDAAMLAVVAGTFIYVGATEVIPEEWEDSEHKWKKFFALISGIVSIFAITQYTMTLESI